MPPPVEPVTSFVSVGSSWVSETSSCNEPPAKQMMLNPLAAEKISSDAIWLKASCGTKLWFPRSVLGKEAVAHFEKYEYFEKPTETSPHGVPFRVETIRWLKEACRKLSAHYHNAFHQLCAELIAQQGGVGQLCECVQAAGYMMILEVQNAILAYLNSSMRGCTTDQLKKIWVRGGCSNPSRAAVCETHVCWSARRETGCSSSQPLVASVRRAVI